MPPPLESRLAHLYATADLVDAYSIMLPPTAMRDIDELARAVLGRPVPWFKILMSLRDAMVADAGLKTSGRLRTRETNAGSE